MGYKGPKAAGKGEPDLVKMHAGFSRYASVAAAILVATVSLESQNAQNWSPPIFHPHAPVEQLQGLCAEEQKTDAEEATNLQTYTSLALRAALNSGPGFWRFLIDPATPYMDRMAAAQQGGKMIDPADMRNPVAICQVQGAYSRSSGVMG